LKKYQKPFFFVEKTEPLPQFAFFLTLILLAKRENKFKSGRKPVAHHPHQVLFKKPKEGC